MSDSGRWRRKSLPRRGWSLGHACLSPQPRPVARQPCHDWCSLTLGWNGGMSSAPRASIRCCNSRGALKRDSKHSCLVTGRSRTERARVLAAVHVYTTGWVHTAMWRRRGHPCRPARKSMCVGGAMRNRIDEPGDTPAATAMYSTPRECLTPLSTVKPDRMARLTFEFQTAVFFTPDHAHWWTESCI